MIEVYQTGIIPLGHLDIRDEDVMSIRGGEILVVDEASTHDVATPDVYIDGTKKIQLRLATDSDTGPFFIANSDKIGSKYNTYGYENSSLYSQSWTPTTNFDASGKQGAFHADGFYAISVDVLDSSITDTLEPNTLLYVSTGGKLSATPGASKKPVGVFVEYRKSEIANNNLSRPFKTAGTFKGSDSIIFFKYNSADGLSDAEIVTLLASQTLENKSLVDSSTLIVDELDDTKRAKFQVSGVSPATTRTYALPDSDGYVALTSDIPTSHTELADIGVNSHLAIDTHLAESSIHFSEGSIDHTAILNIGSNSHTDIDSHIGDASTHHSSTSTLTEGLNLYFTNARAKSASVQDEINDGYLDTAPSQNAVFDALGQKADASSLTTHASDASIHFTEASIDHTAILNIGSNSHAAIDTFISSKGAVNGLASLDGTGKVPATQLPSYVDDVLEYANLASLPVAGEVGKIYITLDTEKTYRWSGTIYVEISPGEVNSVFGRTGVITAQSGDYTWGQINKATSNIADIATRSHTSLTDIGSNSHAQIDTHLGSSANPHGTSIANIGTGTIAQLNAAITDATLATTSDLLWTESGGLVTLSTSTHDVGIGTSPLAKLHARGESILPTDTMFLLDNLAGSALLRVNNKQGGSTSGGVKIGADIIGGAGINHSLSIGGDYPAIICDIQRASGGAAGDMLMAYLSDTTSDTTVLAARLGVFGNLQTDPTPPVNSYLYIGSNSDAAYNNNSMRIYPNKNITMEKGLAIGGHDTTPSGQLQVIGVGIDDTTYNIWAQGQGGASLMLLTDGGRLILPLLPTSSVGLPAGALWDNAGVVNIV